jgi:uncharacterized protein YgiM (DUF1202 family)
MLVACRRGQNTPAATAPPPTTLPPTVIATPAPTQPPTTQSQPELTPTRLLTAPPGQPALVTAAGLHVRSGPGPDFDVVMSVVRCTTIYVLGEEGEWARIEQGYVHRAYITYDMTFPCADYTPQP